MSKYRQHMTFLAQSANLEPGDSGDEKSRVSSTKDLTSEKDTLITIFKIDAPRKSG